jgi:hypothetical protein
MDLPLPLLIKEKIDYYVWRCKLSNVVSEYHKRSIYYDDACILIKYDGFSMNYNWRKYKYKYPIYTIPYHKKDYDLKNKNKHGEHKENTSCKVCKTYVSRLNSEQLTLYNQLPRLPRNYFSQSLEHLKY